MLHEGHCELGYCWRFKEASQWQFDLQAIADARNDLRHLERVAAKSEEVVMDANLLHLKHITPHSHQHLLRKATRRYILLLQLQPALIRGRQRLPVQLAVGSQGQLIDQHKRRGHHVVRQSLLQIASQLTSRRSGHLAGSG